MKHFIINEGSTKIPSNHAAEYLMIVAPSPYQYLCKTIMEVKHNSASRFDCKIASCTKPHVTLVKFFQREIVEDRFIKRFQQIAKKQAHIKVELKDFGSFPGHTIYINVTSKVPLLNLSKNLKEVRPLLKFHSEFNPFFLTVPHLTIARSLLPWQFEKASLEYSNMNFTGHFIANKMILLKRRIGHISYQHVQDFEFSDTPDQGFKQCILFN